MRLTRDTAPSGTAYIAVVTARCQPDGPVTAGKLQSYEFKIAAISRRVSIGNLGRPIGLFAKPGNFAKISRWLLLSTTQDLKRLRKLWPSSSAAPGPATLPTTRLCVYQAGRGQGLLQKHAASSSWNALDEPMEGTKMNDQSEAFVATPRSRVRILRKRGSNERKLVYEILDSALLCNVGYVIDGQPYVTPTAFWREDNHLYWHGSSASRALTAQSAGIPVCVTVTHVDGIVVARSGFHCSINYRSVMAFGRAALVTDEEQRRRAMDTFVDRFIPGRTKDNRPLKANELKITKLLGMEIEEASTKVRGGPPLDDEEDYALPIWAGVINFKTIVSGTDPDPRNLPSLPIPAGVAAYASGQRLDEVLSAIYDADIPERE